MCIHFTYWGSLSQDSEIVVLVVNEREEESIVALHLHTKSPLSGSAGQNACCIIINSMLIFI